MILVDTSIWIDHLHRTEPQLGRLLEIGEVGVHPMVMGELAMGSLREREAVLDALAALPTPGQATTAEVLTLVERHALHSGGLAWVDAHLLAATLITPGARLWARDRRLRNAARDLGVWYAEA